MNRKYFLQYVLSLVVCFLAGCAIALGLRLYDAHSETVTPIAGGQTIDFSEYGFILTVPDSYSMADYTTNNHAEGGEALFAGCVFGDGHELYIFCYDNASGDRLDSYGEQEVVSHYIAAGAQDVRLRTLGGRRFLQYSAIVQNGDAIETWHTYETWDESHQISFETRMSAQDALPILATITFPD
ncbi:MAG: hypothetical protein J6K32_12415 [Clostridia bacterium]|nr:hypothetical protein [Clostridia bacterium]